MTMRSPLEFTIALLAALWLLPAVALGDIVLARGPDAVDDVAVTSSVSSFATEIRLRNTASEAVTRRFRPGSLFRRQTDNLTAPAVWTWISPSRGPVSSSTDVRLPPGGQAAVSLGGQLPEAGVYETAIDVIETIPTGEVEERRIRVLVTRLAAETPEGLLARPAPVALHWPARRGDTNLLIEMRNTGSATLELYRPFIVAFTQGEGDAKTGVAARLQPSLESGRCGTATVG